MTVIKNVGLVLKDSKGNEGIVKTFTDKDINKIANAITDVGQVVDPATHTPIEATKTSAGVVQLATAQDITNGTAGKVVDAQELNNFAQTLPSVNGITDVSSGDNSNQIVVSKFGGSKTLTIDNVEHASNADEATHASQADTAASANSVAWDNVSGKSTTLSGYGITDAYTKSQVDKKVSDLVNSAPETLDTLNELANALGNDPNFATTVANQIGTKANDSNVVHKSGDETIDGVKTFSSTVYSSSYNGLFFRHLDGSNNGGMDGCLYLNYHNSSKNVFFNGVSYYINGGYYNGTSERANSAGWADTSGRVRTQSNSDWYMNCNWDGSYFQTNCISDTGSQLPINVQKANYADSAGSSSIAIRDSGGSWISGRDNAVVKQTRHTTSPGSSWNPVASVKTTDGNWTIGNVGGNELQFSYDTDADYNAGNNTNTIVTLNPIGGTIITTANIGSQSVNYANSAGTSENSNYTYWLRTSSHHDHLVHTEWDGGYFWTYVAASDGGYRAVRVERANSSGWADSAGGVAWGNVSGRPDIWIG